MSRIYLSPPDLAGNELELLREAIASNWIAPLGPHVDAFEAELAARVDMPHAVALSSGTAALHLALEVIGVGPGDEVWMSTFTFAATANAARYVGATPVFIDSDTRTWNMDGALLAQALEDAARGSRLPKAVVAVDLYGQCADYAAIAAACRKHGVVLVEDAAEALGATLDGKPAGSFGDLAAFSFNGNKIITTSGGGMLVSRRGDWIERARYLATQARAKTRHYEHVDIGYNYRLSNLLAAVGRAQLADLERRVLKRRQINATYRARLASLPGWTFMPEAPACRSTFWLTCATIEDAGVTRDALLDRLAAVNIEARPTWKPMHLQPVFEGARSIGGDVARRLFETGICLPSGSSLTPHDQERVIEAIEQAHVAA